MNLCSEGAEYKANDYCYGLDGRSSSGHDHSVTVGINGPPTFFFVSFTSVGIDETNFYKF